MYYFPPMMPLWGRFLGAPTKWLMSNEGRLMIAKAIKLCRKKHGHAEARSSTSGLFPWAVSTHSCPKTGPSISDGGSIASDPSYESGCDDHGKRLRKRHQPRGKLRHSRH